MNSKICTCCNQNKEFNEFYPSPTGKYGINSVCKKCSKEKAKNWTINNPDKAKKRSANYYLNNKENSKASCKRWYENNIKRAKKYKHEWYIENKHRFKEDKIQYNKDHKEEIRAYNKEYYKKNKKVIGKKNKEYILNRLEEDLLFRFKTRLRSNMLSSFKRNNLTKNSRTREILCCELDYFKPHIEVQFEEGMSWDNYGEWVLDHIIPISFAMTFEEVEQLCSYINYQPLWKKENEKKGNNIFYSDKTLQKCIDTWL